MTVELINTGSELMLGRVLNTHQLWLCRRLSDMGYVVQRQLAIPDTGLDIQAAARESLARADLVITTGGLGPTSDDLTRELVAQLLERPLIQDPEILNHLQQFFAARKRSMPTRVALQALVPQGAEVLPNANGTAPGLALRVSPNKFRGSVETSWLIMLPGPPRELRPMFDTVVRPLLAKVLPPPDFGCRIFRTSGIGESSVEELLDAPLQPLISAGLGLGYCARTGQVDVRLTARGAGAPALLAAGERIVRPLIADFLYGEDDEELETAVIKALSLRKETLGVAESCTGGLLAHRLTNTPGASAVFMGGIVSYSNEMKREFLGVAAETLEVHGAVSEPVAREMAEGIRKRVGTTYGMGITGIAGPSGGTPEKPVGTVFLGLAGPSRTIVVRNLNSCDRETFKMVTTQQALELLRGQLSRRG